jgi:hypothetical protein
MARVAAGCIVGGLLVLSRAVVMKPQSDPIMRRNGITLRMGD